MISATGWSITAGMSALHALRRTASAAAAPKYAKRSAYNPRRPPEYADITVTGKHAPKSQKGGIIMSTASEIMQKNYEHQAETIIKALEKRNMKGYYCADCAAAVELAKTLTPAGSTVSFGGSMTLSETGIMDMLSRHANSFFLLLPFKWLNTFHPFCMKFVLLFFMFETQKEHSCYRMLFSKNVVV